MKDIFSKKWSQAIIELIYSLKKFSRVHYHTIVCFVYGIVQLMIPLANQFYVLVIQLSILGFMDGIFLCFFLTITIDLVESPRLMNQGLGYFHLVLTPGVIGKKKIKN